MLCAFDMIVHASSLNIICSGIQGLSACLQHVKTPVSTCEILAFQVAEAGRQ